MRRRSFAALLRRTTTDSGLAANCGRSDSSPSGGKGFDAESGQHAANPRGWSARVAPYPPSATSASIFRAGIDAGRLIGNLLQQITALLARQIGQRGQVHSGYL
ncbi:hypothetical protein NXC24_PB00426 (plasmid) [Rhizobium sp. NXC24]|nr:hypothetical protein NXC24_PB00426 [Rhizobium sp. NXC24]